MKNASFKKTALFIDNKSRITFSDNEIFFDTCTILSQSKFSNEMTYFIQKRRRSNVFFTKIKNRCLLSGYSRSVISRFKISRISFSRKILEGSMVGFYKSI
jgi:ribosomal protein S14